MKVALPVGFGLALAACGDDTTGSIDAADAAKDQAADATPEVMPLYAAPIPPLPVDPKVGPR